MKTLLPIAWTLDRLAAGELTSSGLVKACLEAIANPAGEGARTFVGFERGRNGEGCDV